MLEGGKMFVRSLVFLTAILFFIALGKSSAQDKSVISVGIIYELEQQNVLREISDAFKELDSLQEQIIAAQFILMNRQKLNASIEMFCKSLYSGTSIILDLSYYPWEEAIGIINSAGIPYLKIDISLIPFFRIVEKYLLARGNATDAVLIFQNEKDISEALYYAVRGTHFRVVLLNAMNEAFTQKLKEMRPIPSYYVVFATTSNMDAIFNKIIGANLLTRPDKWHLCFFDFNSEEFFYIKNVTNTTKITLDPKTSCFSKNNYGLCKSPPTTFVGPKIVLTEVLTAITQASKIVNFVHKKWDCKSELNGTIYEDLDTSSEIAKILEESNVLKVVDQEVTLQLNMTMQIYTGASQKYNDTAIWSQEQLKPLQGEIKSSRRFLRIGTVEALPWSYISRDSLTGKPIFDESGRTVWEGYCIDLINKMAVRMSFDYELVIPKKGRFGKRLPDGSWDGLIGDLVTGETDIAVAALKMTSDREEVIDFVAPYFEQTGISIVIRKPVRQTSLFKFMTVLRLEVWLSIVAALVATAVLLWMLDKYSPYSARNNKKAYPYPCRDFTLKESFWFALTSFTPQGGGEPPKAISGRTLVAAYWLFVVLMLATFTANLAAFLTVERMQTPVQSLEQLARQSRINYTVVEGSDTHKYFINMKFAEDTLYRMWKELTLNATSDTEKYRIWDYPIKEQYAHILLAINSSNPVKDATEGFRKVNEHENADFAFIHDSAEIKYEITKNCNLTEVGEVFAEQPYAIAVQQGSNLQDELSYAILEFQKDRYFEELTAKFWNNSFNKECSGSEDNEGITLESLGGVFIATLFGLALAMITLAGEVIYYRRKDRTLKKISPSRKEVENWAIFHSSKDSLKEKLDELKIKPQGPITLGEQFIPVRQARNRISYIPVQPRNPIHETIGYYE